MKFKLLPETLFIAVNLIDRYTEKTQILRKDYQLLGVSCMMIAAKYEEIYPPQVGNFAYITDNAYDRDQILACERDVLTCLDFNLTFPTSLRFLERYAKLTKCNSRIFYLSRYFLELSLIEVYSNKWNPAKLATAALFVAYKIEKEHMPQGIPFLPAQDNAMKEIVKSICLLIPSAHEKRCF